MEDQDCSATYSATSTDRYYEQRKDGPASHWLLVGCVALEVSFSAPYAWRRGKGVVHGACPNVVAETCSERHVANQSLGHLIYTGADKAVHKANLDRAPNQASGF